MKAKALKYKSSDYNTYGKYVGEGEIASCSTPILFPMTFSLDRLKEYVQDVEGCELICSDWREIIVEVTEI